MARRRTFLPPPPPSEGSGFALALTASHAISLDTLCRTFEVASDALPNLLRKLPVVLIADLSLKEANDLSRLLAKGGVTVTTLASKACGSYTRLDLKLKPVPQPGGDS